MSAWSFEEANCILRVIVGVQPLLRQCYSISQSQSKHFCPHGLFWFSCSASQPRWGLAPTAESRAGLGWKGP